jgi:hypothetical protein
MLDFQDVLEVRSLELKTDMVGEEFRVKIERHLLNMKLDNV